MRITLLTNYDAASSLALNYLLPTLSTHTLTVFYTDRSTQRNSAPQILTELAEFERSLDGIDRPFLACKAEVLNNINQPEGLRRFSESEPELTLSVRHMSIFKAPVIAIAKHDTINLHSGLLPAYRGVMATFWAMKNKEQRIGTTLHTIDDNTIDTGSIISQSSTAIDYQQSVLWNTLNLYKTGCDNIIRCVKQIARGRAISSKAQTNKGTYFTFPKPHDIAHSNIILFNKTDSLSEHLNNHKY